MYNLLLYQKYVCIPKSDRTPNQYPQIDLTINSIPCVVKPYEYESSLDINLQKK